MSAQDYQWANMSDYKKIGEVSSLAAKRMECAKCRSQAMRRMERRGWLEERVFSLLGYFPWECKECRKRQLHKHRGLKERLAGAVVSQEA